MKVSIICVGKIREKFINDGIEEFRKRMTPYVSLEILEVPAYQIKQQADELKARQVEAEKILGLIGKDDYSIALVIKGNAISSEGLAQKIDELSKSGINKINFIIGGSTGLDESVIEKAEYKLSFSKMTFPHQLMRLILMEQLYRAFKIINHEPYHK
ncbi:MAG: 23S rRNA (pseudouridine(1915)-N(3))-methyltransferase RlmH [bacterium]|nr:23S rRNA (pseudouridine(1915)-N(3))-methyltransferase RlmH [bacterium]